MNTAGPLIVILYILGFVSCSTTSHESASVKKASEAAKSEVSPTCSAAGGAASDQAKSVDAHESADEKSTDSEATPDEGAGTFDNVSEDEWRYAISLLDARFEEFAVQESLPENTKALIRPMLLSEPSIIKGFALDSAVKNSVLEYLIWAWIYLIEGAYFQPSTNAVPLPIDTLSRIARAVAQSINDTYGTSIDLQEITDFFTSMRTEGY